MAHRDPPARPVASAFLAAGRRHRPISTAHPDTSDHRTTAHLTTTTDHLITDTEAGDFIALRNQLFGRTTEPITEQPTVQIDEINPSLCTSMQETNNTVTAEENTTFVDSMEIMIKPKDVV